MKKILIVILSIIAVLSFSLGLIACNDNGDDANQNVEQNQEQGETQGGNETASGNETEKEFFVLDSDGNKVETSDTTWILDEEVKAVKILGDEYTLSGKSEYPIFVESEEVAFMTFKDLKIVSDKGFGFSVWNTNGLIITLEGENSITVNGYSEYLKTNKQTYGNIGIDMGADLTFVGDGNLNITCGKVRTDLTNKKAFNCGIYSTTGNADLSIATSGKISIVIDKAEGTATTNVLQTGILSDLSVFRIVSGEVDIDIKSSVTSHAEVNVYGVFGILAVDGGKISINVEKRSAFRTGEALALYITNNQSSVDFAVENAESVETDIGYRLAQKTAGEKVVVSLGSEENGVADGETPTDISDSIIVLPPPSVEKVKRAVDENVSGVVGCEPRHFTPPDPSAGKAVVSALQLDGEFVSDIVRAIKEKLCYVALDSEENTDGETPTDELVVNLGGTQMRVRAFTPIIPSKNGETADDHGIVVPGPFRIVPVRHTNGETPTYVSLRVIIKPIKISSVNDSTDGINDEGADSLILAICTSRTVDIDFASGFFKIEVEESADGTNVVLRRHPTIVPIWTTEDDEDEENGNFAEWGEGDVIYLIPLVGGLFSTTITDEEGNVNSLQPRIVVIGKPWYVAMAGETDGECFAIVIAPSGFPDSVEADGEGAISIIGGEGGEEQGETDTTGIIYIEIIYIGIIEQPVESIPVQSAVIMSMDDLRPSRVDYVLGAETVADIVANHAVQVAGGLYLDDSEDGIVEIRGVDTKALGNEAGEVTGGVENGSSIIMINGLAFEYVGGHLYGVAATPTLVEPKWKESNGEALDAIIGWSASVNIIDGSAGGFFRVIVTDSDGVVTGGEEGEGEQWTVSNEGGTVIIFVPQGVMVDFIEEMQADGECEPEEVSTFMSSRIVTAIGARHINEVIVSDGEEGEKYPIVVIGGGTNGRKYITITWPQF